MLGIVRTGPRCLPGTEGVGTQLELAPRSLHRRLQAISAAKMSEPSKPIGVEARKLAQNQKGCFLACVFKLDPHKVLVWLAFTETPFLSKTERAPAHPAGFDCGPLRLRRGHPRKLRRLCSESASSHLDLVVTISSNPLFSTIVLLMMSVWQEGPWLPLERSLCANQKHIATCPLQSSNHAFQLFCEHQPVNAVCVCAWVKRVRVRTCA